MSDKVRPHHESVRNFDQGWLGLFARTTRKGMTRFSGRDYDDLEVRLSRAAAWEEKGGVSPRVIEDYAVVLIRGLGMEAQVREALARCSR